MLPLICQMGCGVLLSATGHQQLACQTPHVLYPRRPLSRHPTTPCSASGLDSIGAWSPVIPWILDGLSVPSPNFWPTCSSFGTLVSSWSTILCHLSMAKEVCEQIHVVHAPANMVRDWEMLKEEIEHHPDGDTSHRSGPWEAV